MIAPQRQPGKFARRGRARAAARGPRLRAEAGASRGFQKNLKNLQKFRGRGLRAEAGASGLAKKGSENGGFQGV